MESQVEREGRREGGRGKREREGRGKLIGKKRSGEGEEGGVGELVIVNALKLVL